MTCGETSAGAYRCIGNHLRAISNGAVAEEAHGPITVAPDRIAARIR
jgi:hypothetical protein